jgi:hypothetical protein
VKRSPAEVADVPAAVVTVTSTVPADPAGLVTTICEPLSLTMVVPVVPKYTVAVLAVPRFVPVIVTVVPPAVLPEAGLIEETLGVDQVDEPMVSV